MKQLLAAIAIGGSVVAAIAGVGLVAWSLLGPWFPYAVMLVLGVPLLLVGFWLIGVSVLETWARRRP